jgi:hypothetical protein
VSGQRVAGALLVLPSLVTLVLGVGFSPISWASLGLGLSLFFVQDTWLSELLRALVLLRALAGAVLAIALGVAEGLWLVAVATTVYCAAIAGLMLNLPKRAHVLALGSVGLLAFLVASF